jgi:hypothetical protein
MWLRCIFIDQPIWSTATMQMDGFHAVILLLSLVFSLLPISSWDAP